ncbi:hypothetical protein PORCRE_1866 [Porphyromonas crevioricanis JCM 15906]|uniref:Uncharacterized protein n=1 Tax=Porphyromonas crevioricanis JCM 15906 TaxID=1305617 RepID=T1DU04_9PORP|nr:hypothetical protein PORCRE_1866 [Porphyromonas crevioricanis JCM 15906]
MFFRFSFAIFFPPEMRSLLPRFSLLSDLHRFYFFVTRERTKILS